MEEIITIIFQSIILCVISICGILVKKYIIPWVKTKMKENNIVITQEQYDIAVKILKDLVKSAYRLQITGKLEDAKTHVMNLAKEQLNKLGINLTDEMIDEIRRSALIEWEASVGEMQDELISSISNRKNIVAEASIAKKALE